MNAVLERESPKEAARRLAKVALSEGFQPFGLHRYTDAEGEPLYWRIRLKHANGEKWIRPMRLGANGFELKEPAFSDGKPLYLLHRLAASPNASVWIVEGEQKAEALDRLGLIATTSGGASSSESTDWQPLAGRTCVIWPDNDEPGAHYATAVRRILEGLGATVSSLDVAALGLPEKGDVMDWLKTRPNATGRDIEALPMASQVPEPQAAPKPDFESMGVIALQIDELLTREFPPKESLLHPWLRKQDLSMVYAEGLST